MEEIIQLYWHQYPLRRRIHDAETVSWCYGCRRWILAGEATYVCPQMILHEECAGMAREIRHPVHSSHPLTLTDFRSDPKKTKCAVCEEHGFYYGLGYICGEGCDLWIHMRCVLGVQAAVDKQVMKHPSHPEHELRFMRGKKRSCSFECDACGTTEKGNSYTCSSFCDYWIHESCATLPTTARFHHHPDHSLSLAFHPPLEYVMYEYTCGICNGALRLSQWVYHCQLCSYVVHIKCATNTLSAATSNLINKENGAAGALKFPINDMYEELIIPFVKRHGGQNSIHHQHHHHHHPLSFTTFSSSSSSHDDDEDEDHDDDVDSIEGSELTCNGCTMPIRKSKSSTHQDDDGYMSCGECNYFLHLACFNLPLEFNSLPYHKYHKLKLQIPTEGNHRWVRCWTCSFETNGLYYSCTKCSWFKIDIKCAALPETIKHAGHPQQHHYLNLVTDTYMLRMCRVCHVLRRHLYKCDNCTFSVCCGCVLLPASNRHRFEKHELPLTYDASVNHPTEFYCSSCERKMNPKLWMYHCRDCDQSFHPDCIPATSGEFRNINFGRQQYQVSIHHHPIRFQIVSKNKCCKVCRSYAYDRPGYQCVSCYFVMCGEGCGVIEVKPIE